MERRSFIKSAAGAAIAASFVDTLLPDQNYWETDLAKSFFDRYVEACREVGMSAEEFGKISVVEIYNTVSEPKWIPRQFRYLKKGDIFRMLNPDGYDKYRGDYKYEFTTYTTLTLNDDDCKHESITFSDGSVIYSRALEDAYSMGKTYPLEKDSYCPSGTFTLQVEPVENPV